MFSIRSLYDKIEDSRFELAFIDNTLDDVISGKHLSFKRVKHAYTDRWFADPFIIGVSYKQHNDGSKKPDKIDLLVEDFRYSEKKAVISKLTIDAHSMRIVRLKEVLRLTSHLSFPIFYKQNDNKGKEHIYVYPENGSGFGLRLYEYLPKDEIMKPLEVISKRPLADTVLVRLFGDQIMLTTELPNPNGNLLEIFRQNDEGAYELSQTFLFPENIARGAGNILFHKGHIYRPAQECNHTYGHAISLQEILKNTDGSFNFKEVRRIVPPTLSFCYGIHTFNSYDGIIVTDLKYFSHPILGPVFYKLYSLYK